jgi:hypothetical protein
MTPAASKTLKWLRTVAGWYIAQDPETGLDTGIVIHQERGGAWHVYEPIGWVAPANRHSKYKTLSAAKAAAQRRMGER